MNIMTPEEAVTAKPPNVWLTSTYGFGPHEWGCLVFTNKKDRENFQNRSIPGALVVIYGGSKCIAKERGKVLGIFQCSDNEDDTKKYMPPHIWEAKQKSENKDRWNHAIEVVRAWQVIPEQRPHVRDFAGISYDPKLGQHISRRGIQLTENEVQKILQFDLVEVDVFGKRQLAGSVIAHGADILTPSSAGCVSQSPFVTRESEGPKHLYILQLVGNETNFLGQEVGKRIIVKVGMSKSPEIRCNDFNRSLPACEYKWHVLHSTFREGAKPFPSSAHAIAGEDKMKSVLSKTERSLGGEFFLSSKASMASAWSLGKVAAASYEP